MVALESFLLSLFDYLRHQGMPLGVSEYELAVRYLHNRLGGDDLDKLRRFCRLLWAKSRKDQEDIDQAFDEGADLLLRLLQEVKPEIIKPPVQPPSETGREPQPTLSQKPHPPPEEHPSPEAHPEGPGPAPTYQQTRGTAAIILDRLPLIPTFIFDQPQKFQLTPRWPLSKREMAITWRHYRSLLRSGPDEELDAEGTIADICTTGVFLRPRLRPRRLNQARLVVLLDRDGSMAPFEPFITAFSDSIIRGGMLGRVSFFYFHDCPGEWLYRQPGLTAPIRLGDACSQTQGGGVLIVSDAGAARGKYDSQRVTDTQSFLKILNGYTYLYAWLNPVPGNRWPGTTASDIARLASMFPLDQEGLEDCVAILRGNPFPREVDLDAELNSHE